ncbi:hypothetical protein ACHAXR_007573 [Thalassiosira sp. AJA248-18]
MSEAAGRGGRGGRGGAWATLRQTVRNNGNGDNGGGGDARRPKLLNVMKMKSFKFSQRNFTHEKVVPEEGGDLHKYFRTCSSLTRIREELRNALNEDAERKLGFGLNACARPEESTGRLLLHSIGLNYDLISIGGGATAAQSRVNQFVLQELLPAYPSAIVEEDDEGRIPFVEPIIQWIEARRAVRKWKLDTDRTREKVSLVAAKLQKKNSVAAAKREYHSDSDSEDGSSAQGNRPRTKTPKRLTKGSSLSSWFSGNNENAEKQARMELKLIVDSADDAMFCIDEKGVILITNHAASKKFGYAKREMMGKNISMICNQTDAPRHGEYLARYLKTGEKRVMGKKRELKARRKDGSIFFIELGLTEVNLGGGKRIFCGFVKDVTELRRLRRSLDYEGNEDGPSEDGPEEGGKRISNARGIPPLVEWCLTILSEYVDNHGFQESSGKVMDEDDEEDSLDSSMTDLKASFTSMRGFNESSPVTMRDTRVVEKVAAIPHLLEELLLVAGEARSRVFDMSIVHKVLFNIDSLGDGEWLIAMLDKSIRVQKQKFLDANLTGADVDTAEGRAFQLQLKLAQEECHFLAEGAIFYVEQVSELNIQDDLYVFHHVQMQREASKHGGVADMISTGDVHHFEKNRDELFDADDFVKRAAATPVIRKLLDKIMFSPFASLAALFDGINHFLLMISFRLGPAPALFHLACNDTTFQPQQYLFASVTLMGSVSYFATKAVHAGLAKHALSENLFWSDAFTFWNLLDTVPLLMVLFCSVAVDIVLRQRVHAGEEVDQDDIPFILRTGVAITTPFLWLRIMAFVKVRNKQLATFILCTVEIMKDIKWFLLVLFAAMASFAQMWVSLTFELNQSEDQIYMEGYLKAYTMMLGDLDSDALRTHPLIAVLFVVYTFGVTVVLLNILIAIVSDSYQNSFVSSKMMLGKARVMFVSELLSLKTFHQMWMDGKTGTTRRNVNYLFGVMSVIHMWRITETINVKLGQELFCAIGTLSPNTVKLEAILAFLFLFCVLVVMKVTIAYVLNEFNDTGGLKSNGSLQTPSWFQLTVNWFVKYAYSAMSNSFDSLFDSEEGHREFGNSPVTQEHRSDKAIQHSIEKTRKTLKAELKGMFDQLQLSLREMEEKQQGDMSQIEELISSAITSAITESKQIMVNAGQPENSKRREMRRTANGGRRLSIEEEDENSQSDSSQSDNSRSSLVLDDHSPSMVRRSPIPN